MAALTDLYSAPLLLSVLMGSDARLMLISAIAWLDPDSLIRPSPDPRYIDFDYDAEDDLTVALHVCRTCFTDVFAGASQLQLQGAQEFLVARFLLEGINSHLVAPRPISKTCAMARRWNTTASILRRGRRMITTPNLTRDCCPS